jgi:hypothetical protein
VHGQHDNGGSHRDSCRRAAFEDIDLTVGIASEAATTVS